MYYLNKIIGGFLNPLGIGMLLMLVAVVLRWLKANRKGPLPASLARFCAYPAVRFLLVPRHFLILSFVWLWFWSTGAVERWLGLSLEREFPPQRVESLPQADAIVVLGGGTGFDTNLCPHVELFAAGDRAWQGARLYKAGKAPCVFVTQESDAAALVELGVPREAVRGPSAARNTEEEARFVAGVLKGVRSPTPGAQPPARPKVLLVTSAWHMRRAKLMFERYAKGVEIVPAAADYETIVALGRPLEFKDFVPDPVALGRNAYFFKEVIGYWGYRRLRGGSPN